MSEDIKERVHLHDKLLLGDPENPAMPGLIADRDRMSFEQKRTNEILTELKESVQWLSRVVVGAVITGIVGVGGIIAEVLLHRGHP